MNEDRFPNATDYLRFVQRIVTTIDGVPVQHAKVLQQWWESTSMVGQPEGEWRDVQLLPEDARSPYDADWPACPR